MASCGLSIRIPHSVLLRIAHRRCMGATGSHPQHRRCISTLRKRTELRKTTWCSSWREPPSFHWRRSLLRVVGSRPVTRFFALLCFFVGRCQDFGERDHREGRSRTARTSEPAHPRRVLNQRSLNSTLRAPLPFKSGEQHPIHFAWGRASNFRALTTQNPHVRASSASHQPER